MTSPQPKADRNDSAGSPMRLERADRTAFSRKTLMVLAIVGAVSLAATVILPLVTEADSPAMQTPKATPYSVSALGHRAFVAWLDDIGLDPLVSRSGSGAKAGPTQPLVVISPDYTAKAELQNQINRAIAAEAPVVVVLPKWLGVTDPDHPTWVRRADLASSVRPGTVLEFCRQRVTNPRPGAPQPASNRGRRPDRA